MVLFNQRKEAERKGEKMANYTKATKAGFIREIVKHGWHYVWCGDTNALDLDFVANRLNEIHDNIMNGDIVEMRKYVHTSGNRVVSSTGSILDLTKHETVYQYENGYIVENKYSRWAYVRMC